MSKILLLTFVIFLINWPVAATAETSQKFLALSTADYSTLRQHCDLLAPYQTYSNKFTGDELYVAGKLELACAMNTEMSYQRQYEKITASINQQANMLRQLIAGTLPQTLVDNRWISDFNKADTPEAQALFLRVYADQYHYQAPPNSSEQLSDIGWTMFWKVKRQISSENVEWLKQQLTQIPWFTISKYGEDASLAAWLIAQHADDDQAWQRKMLEMLDKQRENGEFQPQYYALMKDRVLVNSGKKQVFGSQGRCTSSGRWEPFPVEEPANVDQRRAEMHLEPLANYRKRFRCH